MSCRAIAYEGKDPYLFLSYCHADGARVYPIFEKLAMNGCRVWYDNGNHGGDDWLDNIETHLENAEAMIAFISGNSSLSHNCKAEITYALQLKMKVIPILIEDVLLPKGIRMQLSYFHHIKCSETTEGKLIQKLFSTDEVRYCVGDKIWLDENPTNVPEIKPDPISEPTTINEKPKLPNAGSDVKEPGSEQFEIMSNLPSHEPTNTEKGSASDAPNSLPEVTCSEPQDPDNAIIKELNDELQRMRELIQNFEEQTRQAEIDRVTLEKKLHELEEENEESEGKLQELREDLARHEKDAENVEYLRKINGMKDEEILRHKQELDNLRRNLDDLKREEDEIEKLEEVLRDSKLLQNQMGEEVVSLKNQLEKLRAEKVMHEKQQEERRKQLEQDLRNAAAIVNDQKSKLLQSVAAQDKMEDEIEKLEEVLRDSKVLQSQMGEEVVALKNQIDKLSAEKLEREKLEEERRKQDKLKEEERKKNWEEEHEHLMREIARLKEQEEKKRLEDIEEAQELKRLQDKIKRLVAELNNRGARENTQPEPTIPKDPVDSGTPTYCPPKEKENVSAHSVLLCPAEKKAFALSRQHTSIGRSPLKCDVVLSANNAISKLHAQIRLFHDKVSLMDLGSSNGTFVNGHLLIPNRPVALSNPAFFFLHNELLILLFDTNVPDLLLTLSCGNVELLLNENTGAYKFFWGDELLLNRNPVNIWPDGTLNDKKIHRDNHAKLIRTNDGIFLVDEHPEKGNRVYLNDSALKRGDCIKISSGDRISLGNTSLRFVEIHNMVI